MTNQSIPETLYGLKWYLRALQDAVYDDSLSVAAYVDVASSLASHYQTAGTPWAREFVAGVLAASGDGYPLKLA